MDEVEAHPAFVEEIGTVIYRLQYNNMEPYKIESFGARTINGILYQRHFANKTNISIFSNKIIFKNPQKFLLLLTIYPSLRQNLTKGFLLPDL